MVLWPAGIAIGVPVAISLFETFTSTVGQFGFFVFIFDFISSLSYLIACVVSFCLSILALARFQWRKSTGYAILPAVMLCIIFWPNDFIPSLSVGDYVHYWAFHHRYEAAVDASHAPEPRLLCFYWRDASTIAAGETLVFLVFDESDEILQPKLKRSLAWQARAIRGFAKGAGFPEGPSPVAVGDMAWHRLFGHYYVVQIDY